MFPSIEVTHDFSKLWFTGRLELLQGMSQAAVHRFNSMTRRTKRRRGEWVFVHGEPADSIYLLQKGRMKITAFSEDGHEVVHEILGPGEIFGDTSTILGIPRTTSAQTLEASLLCEVRQKDFESLLTAYPELTLQLLKSVGRRLKKAEAQLLNVICNDVSTRVREALLDLMAFESGMALPQKSEIDVGNSQYRNAVASGRVEVTSEPKEYRARDTDPTLPRYGTDCFQVRTPNFEARPSGVQSDQPVRIKITQQDLANLIGASRQKTWEALKELEDSGVLTLMYRSILVTAPHKLRNGHFARYMKSATAKSATFV